MLSTPSEVPQDHDHSIQPHQLNQQPLLPVPPDIQLDFFIFAQIFVVVGLDISSLALLDQLLALQLLGCRALHVAAHGLVNIGEQEGVGTLFIEVPEEVRSRDLRRKRLGHLLKFEMALFMETGKGGTDLVLFEKRDVRDLVNSR